MDLKEIGWEVWLPSSGLDTDGLRALVRARSIKLWQMSSDQTLLCGVS
jgi:hypothetical protein